MCNHSINLKIIGYDMDYRKKHGDPYQTCGAIFDKWKNGEVFDVPTDADKQQWIIEREAGKKR